MKIYKSGKVIAELPDKPKNFEGVCKDGKLSIVIGDEEVTLAHYDSQTAATKALRDLRKCYLAGATVFDLT